MKITLKDGSAIEFDKPITVGEVALNISEGLFRVATKSIPPGLSNNVASKVNYFTACA